MRGPTSGVPSRTKESMIRPPANVETTPFVAVATFEIPM